MYRVRGTLLDSRTGQPPAGNVQVMLGYRSPTGSQGSFSSGRNYDPATGRFELLNVIPGQYVVQAQIQEPLTTSVSNVQQLEERQAQQAMQPMGRTPITVTNGDVEGVAVVLTTAVPLPGKVSVEGQGLEAATGIDRMRVTVRAPLDSIAATGNQPAPGVVRADGTFQIAGLREGEFMVQAGALPVGFYVKSINYGGSDVLNAPFKFSGSASGTMDVVLRSGLGRITGVVSDARSQGVARVLAVLIPQQRDRSDLYRTSTTDQTGQFNFANVVPGSYRIFSWEAFEQGMQYDPDLLKKHEQQGRVVQVTESTEQKVDLRMIPMN